MKATQKTPCRSNVKSAPRIHHQFNRNVNPLPSNHSPSHGTSNPRKFLVSGHHLPRISLPGSPTLPSHLYPFLKMTEYGSPR